MKSRKPEITRAQIEQSIDASFWEKLPKREVVTCDQMRLRGYRNSLDLAGFFGVGANHVKPHAERFGLLIKRVATSYNGQTREMDWYYKPKA